MLTVLCLCGFHGSDSHRLSCLFSQKIRSLVWRINLSEKTSASFPQEISFYIYFKDLHILNLLPLPFDGPLTSKIPIYRTSLR